MHRRRGRRARVHRRPRHVAARAARSTSRRSRRWGARDRHRRRPLLRDGPRPALGPRPRRRSTCWSTAGPSTTPIRREDAASRPTSAARPTSSSSRPQSATTPGSAPATPSSPSTSAPTGCARSRAESFASRAAAPRRRTRPSPSTTRTGTYPVIFPPRRPEITLAQVISDAGKRPAARGRDGEVPARHVLLQRRRGASVRGRGARARAVARATSRPTTTSRR